MERSTRRPKRRPSPRIAHPPSAATRPRTTAGTRAPTPERGAAAARGSAAERAVAAWLEERGFEIVATNLRVGRLEIDIVARHERTIVVVEVRSRGRTAWQSGFGSIGAKKRERIRAAGLRLWQDRYARDASVDRMRFDAASVTFDGGLAVVDYAAAAF